MVKGELAYEPADKTDIDCLYRLNKDIIEKYEDIGSIDFDKVMTWVGRKLTAHIHEYKRILVNREIAGYFRLHSDEDKMELDDLYVFPKFQSQGIGTMVISKCIKDTELPIYLYVFIRNKRAVALYRRLGFHVIETIKNSRYIMQREK